MKIRKASVNDIVQMSLVLKQLTAVGKRTLPDDESFVLERYIDNPDNVLCSVAETENSEILGFQVLMRAVEGNIYDVKTGWGVIGTHIRPDVARQGIGRRLFGVTQKAAEQAGIPTLDATIDKTNQQALAYYDAMGFKTYRIRDGFICKHYDVGE